MTKMVNIIHPVNGNVYNHVTPDFAICNIPVKGATVGWYLKLYSLSFLDV